MVRSRIEVQNGNDELTFDSGMVTIGGRTGVNVILRDVMVADRHCVITYEDGFVVRDTGSVTGTWVNGERAAPSAPLRDGAAIIIGTSKLQVALEEDDGVQVLKLKTEPQSFWWKKSSKGAFDNDPDQLAYSETKFGRFPALHLSNRVAMIAGSVVLLAATFVSSIMEPLADPGPLMPPHALVTTAAIGDPRIHTGIEQCVTLAGEQGCNVCHTAGSGAPESKCVQCHGRPGKMGAAGSFRHPYHNDGKLGTVVGSIAGTMGGEQFCVVCHTDHKPAAEESDAQPAGAGADNQEDQKKQPTWLKPIAETLTANCAACHDDGSGSYNREQLIASAPLNVPPAQPQAFDNFLFPHDQHLAKEIDCLVCHRIDEALLTDRQRRVPDDPLRQDFSTVAYAVCASCHVKDAPAANMTVAEQRQWRSKEFQANVAWHGIDDSGSHCRQCHAQSEREATTVFGPEMKTVERAEFTVAQYQQERARYAVTSRSHEEQFSAHANGQACTQCHLNGEIAAPATQRSARVFWHGLHVQSGSLAPNGSAQRGRISLDTEQGCVSCHSDLGSANANRLTPLREGLYHWPDTSAAQAACADCHREGKQGLQLTAANTQTSASSREVADFPHDLHVGSKSFGSTGSLQQGCFACHDFSSANGDSPFSQVPRTKPGASNCTDCHGGHDNIAGGACQKCHPKIDGASNSFLQHAKIATPPPATRPWPAPNGFSHLSTGHKDEGCATCHKNTGLEQAATLEAVRVPDEQAAVCRDCHLQKQFHWR